MSGGLVVVLMLAMLVVVVVAKTARVVPQQSAFVVERLGKYSTTLNAGFHILVPFFDVVRYKHSLKETAIDIPEQICITRDNVQVGVDGVLYMKVLDPHRASYGISDYQFAITQLAQTTLRSEIGKIDLDRTFEERTNINIQVVNELDKEAGFIRKSPRDKAVNLINKLASETGGRAFFPESLSELPQIANEIIRDLRTQYVLAYNPTNKTSDGTYRAIKVTVDQPSSSSEKRIALTRTGRLARRESATSPKAPPVRLPNSGPTAPTRKP